MKPGDRIYYTGDMANMGGYGTITAYHPAGRFNPEAVDIVFDEERFEGDTEKKARMVYVMMFNPGPGRRFWLAEEYDAAQKAQRKTYINEMVRTGRAYYEVPGDENSLVVNG